MSAKQATDKVSRFSFFMTWFCVNLVISGASFLIIVLVFGVLHLFETPHWMEIDFKLGFFLGLMLWLFISFISGLIASDMVKKRAKTSR